LVLQHSDLQIVPMQNVSNGMYFVQIQTNQGTVFKKVLKK